MFLKGTTSWACYDLFGGVLCVRRAWEMIEAAARHLWGVECRVSHTFTVSLQAGCSEQTTYSCIVYKKLGDMLGVLVSLGPAQVEKARTCIALSKQSYPGSCIFQISCTWSRTLQNQSHGIHHSYSLRNMGSANNTRQSALIEQSEHISKCAQINWHLQPDASQSSPNPLN